MSSKVMTPAVLVPSPHMTMAVTAANEMVRCFIVCFSPRVTCDFLSNFRDKQAKCLQHNLLRLIGKLPDDART